VTCNDIVLRLVEARSADEIEEIFAVYSPTVDEAKAAATVLNHAAITDLQSAGVLPAQSTTVLDLDVRALAALAGVYSVVCRSPVGNRSPRLADMLKTMTPGDVHDVMWLLAWGGFLPESDVPPKPIDVGG
jgi:hypothetical protein